MVSESVLKTKATEAEDRLRGDSFVKRYQKWTCVRQIRPRNLKLFDLILLAHATHMEAPFYTPLKDNCYWYVATIFDAIVAMFDTDNLDSLTDPEDIGLKGRYVFEPKGSGRWKGLKVTISNPDQVTSIISRYRNARTKQLAKVSHSFQSIVPY
jgi:hypothetical protein